VSRRRPIRVKAPRRLRSRRNPGLSRLEKDLLALEERIKDLNEQLQAARQAKNKPEKKRLTAERDPLLFDRHKLREKVAAQKKRQPRLDQAKAAGLAPMFSTNKKAYDALKAGGLRFLSEPSRNAQLLGIEKGEVVRSAVVSKDTPLEWFFVRVYGMTPPPGVELENHRAGNTIYEFFRAPPEGAKVRATGPLLPSCADATNLDLYVLPINPGFAKRYVMSVLVWMSDLPEVSAIIEKAATQIEAITALVGGVVVDGIPLHIPPEYARKLLLLNLDEGDENLVRRHEGQRNPESPKWRKFRKDHAAKDQDRMGELPPRFGFYEEVLAPIGWTEAIQAAFGAAFQDCPNVQGYNCRQYSSGTIKILPGSKSSVGAVLQRGNKHWDNFTTAIRKQCGDSAGPGARGAPSLSGLLVAWEGAQGAWRGKKVYPTFYRAMPKVTRSLTGGVPVAIVITGPRGQTEGYRISGNNPTVEPVRNMIALGEALLWGNPARVAREACFLLPPIVLKGMGLTKTEITGTKDYERLLALSPLSPMTHFRALAAKMDFPDQASLARAQELLVTPPRFFQSTPRAEWISFFGEIPQVQAWPGVYYNIVKWGFKQGIDRTAISGWMEDHDQHLHHYREIGDGAEITMAGAEFGSQRRTIESFTVDRPGGREQLRVHHLTPCAWAEVDFSQNLLDGTPGAGMVIPTRLVIFRRSRGGAVIPQLVYDLQEIREDHIEAWVDKPKKYVAPLRAKVMLINTALAIDEAKKVEDTGENPIMSPGAIRALLRAKALPLGSEQWFLALPRSESAAMLETLEQIPGRKGEEPLVRVKREVVWDDSYSPFYGSPALIPRVARDLLRVGVSTVGVPHLVPVPPDAAQPAIPARSEKARGTPARPASPPWTSQAAPYLFLSLPVRMKGGDGKWHTRMMRPGEDPVPNGYLNAYLRAFKFSPRSETQKGAVQAVVEGAEIEGKREKRGRPTEATRVATKRGFKGSGFYWLAAEVVKDLRLGRLTTTPTDQEVLYAAMRPAWPLIVQRMNEGLEDDEKLSPAMPFPFRAGQPGDPQLEREALAALEALMDPEDGELEVLFTEDDLIHPARYGLTGEDAETMGDFFHPDVQGVVHGIKNPRRRRRGRRPRRSRGRSRDNPWSRDERDRVAAWAARDEELGDVSFSRPKTNEEMFSAVEEVYPRAASQRALRTQDRLDALAVSEQDLFGSFRPGAVDPERDKTLRQAILSGALKLTEEDQAYLARHADLSLVEGKRILDERRRSKRRASMVTPSGALCKMYRNAARLKGYSPMLPVARPGTAWILVGPPVKEDGLTRVMAFRNGGYVDCDMLVPANQPLSFFLGKAIQGMVMWLAEKQIRTIRMAGGVHLGLIGSAQTRQLWRPGDHLDVQAMLKKAYSGEVTTHLVAADEAGRPDAHVLARDRAQVDFKNYAARQKKVAPPSSYPQYRRTKEAAVGDAAATGLSAPTLDLSDLSALEDE